MIESKLSQPLDFTWDERTRRTGTRQELPWDLITQDVLNAITDHYQGKKFINIKHLAEYIETTDKHYIYLSDVHHDTIITRIGRVLDKRLHWHRHTAVGSRASVYVDPRVIEE